MYSVDLYARVRRACFVDGMSKREAVRVFGIDRKTVDKMLAHSVPPDYRRGRPPSRPKLGSFTGIIDQILEEDRRVHRKPKSGRNLRPGRAPWIRLGRADQDRRPRHPSHLAQGH